MVIRCENESCEFIRRCSIRMAGMVDTIQETDSLSDATPPALSSISRESWRDPVQFTVRLSPHGWIGLLLIRGKLENNIQDPIAEVASQLGTLAGLLIVLESAGGSHWAGELAHGLVVMARERMPVVSYVKDCLSTTMLTLAASDAAFCHHNAAVGCFGNLLPICDGMNPATLVSSQSPRKHDGRAFDWPERTFATPDDIPRLQARMNRRYERDFSLVAEYTGADPERLRTCLDGRCLTPKEAVEAGLIDEICSEDAAFCRLLDLVETKKGE